jgi:hypothetical protein
VNDRRQPVGCQPAVQKSLLPSEMRMLLAFGGSAPLEDDDGEQAEGIRRGEGRGRDAHSPAHHDLRATSYLGEGTDAPGYNPHHTTFASQAAMFAVALADKFANRTVGQSPRRILRIEEPEGPSTAGGRLARQPLSLVARKGTAPVLVCGWVDVPNREAQLRSYQSLANRHEARHGAPLDLPQDDYDRFLDELSDALTSGDIRVRVVVPDEKEPVPASPQPLRSQGPSIPLWLALLLAGFAFMVGTFTARAFQ